MSTFRRAFIVRDEAHRKLKCSRCRGLMDAGDLAVSIVSDGYAEMQHADECPPRRVWGGSDPDKRVIQGAKP